MKKLKAQGLIGFMALVAAVLVPIGVVGCAVRESQRDDDGMYGHRLEKTEVGDKAIVCLVSESMFGGGPVCFEETEQEEEDEWGS